MLSTDNLYALDGNWEAGQEKSKHLSSFWKRIFLDTDQYKCLLSFNCSGTILWFY